MGTIEKFVGAAAGVGRARGAPARGRILGTQAVTPIADPKVNGEPAALVPLAQSRQCRWRPPHPSQPQKSHTRHTTMSSPAFVNAGQPHGAIFDDVPRPITSGMPPSCVPPRAGRRARGGSL